MTLDFAVGGQKLDSRLRALLRLPLEELRRFKREERQAHRELHEAIEALCAEAVTAEGDRLLELTIEIEKRVLRQPVPLTFGLYFPEDDAEDVARVTHLEEPFVSVTVRSHASAQDLASLGLHVRNQAGNILTAYVPLGVVPRLQLSPAIDYVELARPWRSQLDQAIPHTQIDTLHAASPAVTGKDVIVGFIETGPLDFYHPAFRRPDDTLGQGGLGSSRVLYLWDQTLTPDMGKGESSPPTEASVPALPGFNPIGGAYGTEYDQAKINKDLTDYPPAYGTVRSNPVGSFHGTLVASCGVGNKRTPDYSYVGAAPEADIIYVRTTNGNNYVFADSTNILDGFAYIFARANQLAKPCVVNLSASDGLGPHDGCTLGEQFLDNLLLEPGRAITCSAGNDNLGGSHASGKVTSGNWTNLTLTYVFPLMEDTIQIWYDGHDEFDVTLTVPTLRPTVIGPVASGTAPLSTVVGGVTVTVESTLNHAHNNDNLIEVRITGGTIPPGDWIVALYGSKVINGAFDAWVDSTDPWSHWQASVADNGTIGVPATALRPIAVGAHDGTAGPSIVNLSGCGPTRDGRIKPEIAAPGAGIRGAWSRDMNSASPGSLEFPPPEIPELEPATGTSYAAPIVAGAAALLFECRGKGLTCGDIKQILADSAGTPPLGIPSNAFGFGFLQMAAACTAPVPTVDVWLRDSPTDTGIEPYTGAVGWLSPDIDVLDAAGNAVANPMHDPANLWNNLIDVTIRNRGTQAARNVEVYLYWADPATSLPFPSEWKISGIYTGQPALVQQGNKIVVSQLAAGANTTVRFAWAPPAPATNIRGDDHFCLIARIEHEADPSNLAAGGWPVIQGSNNIGLRNVHVQDVSLGNLTMACYVIGSDDTDALELTCEKFSGGIELFLPTRALLWRELALLERCQGQRPDYGCPCGTDPAEEVRRVLRGKELTRILGVTGAAEAHVDGTLTRLVADPAGRHLLLSELRVQRGAKMPIRVWAREPRLEEGVGRLNIGQRSGGKLVGGVSLELREQLPEITRYDVRRRGKKVQVSQRMLTTSAVASSSTGHPAR